ncbi:uncharacterized protein LOC129916409 [Episyrphus balteatus]|uniref:uncharacterized protein LOC129916409 n=1 Tax=Episyrphus balteatus TaxID=286459 RepID=UPI0024858516|nr:uncharacterized protein LOC129916409 [Episyrphus balteatus]
MQAIQINASIILLLSIGYFVGVESHGMMMQPVSRGSRWRVDSSAPKNYDDNGLFCGGYGTQWSTYGGKCGLCGDSYGEPTPRPHENGGTFGEGVIVELYKAGQIAEISVKITTNHKGKFIFHLCNIDSQPESEECFDNEPLELSSGGYEYQVKYGTGYHNASVIIPSDVACSHCVIRWTYITANSWGICEDGSGALGCGPQEQFKNCADVAILPSSLPIYNEIP